MKDNKQSGMIYECLLKTILSDGYEVGDRLPTEMELCSRYGVSRSTVREAISMLQAKGIVSVRRGSGTYVASKQANGETNGLVIDRIESLRDFMEIRISIETLAVRLFIKQYNERNVERLQECEKKFEKAVRDNDVDRMSEYDETFHKIIFEGTENSLLISIGDVLSRAFKSYRNKTFSKSKHREDAVTAHRAIIDSLKRKDTNDAIMNMHMHLDVSYENAVRS